MLAEVSGQLGVLPGLAECLDPHLARVDRVLPEPVERARDRERPLARVGLGGDDRLGRLLQALGHGLEAGDVQVALGREVPVQDRLAHARGASDLRGRGAAVAPLAEDLQRGVDDRRPPLGGRHPEALLDGRLTHAAAATSASAGSPCRTFRTSAMATSAPEKAMAAAT